MKCERTRNGCNVTQRSLKNELYISNVRGLPAETRSYEMLYHQIIFSSDSLHSCKIQQDVKFVRIQAKYECKESSVASTQKQTAVRSPCPADMFLIVALTDSLQTDITNSHYITSTNTLLHKDFLLFDSLKQEFS